MTCFGSSTQIGSCARAASTIEPIAGPRRFLLVGTDGAETDIRFAVRGAKASGSRCIHRGVIVS